MEAELISDYSQKACYNEDKEEMAVDAKKTYDSCQIFIDEGREEINNITTCQIEQVNVRGRTFLNFVPNEAIKLQHFLLDLIK